jgi:hypothetical protein
MSPLSSGVFLPPSPQFRGVGWDWMHSVRRPLLIGLLYQPQMIVDEYGTFGGMGTGRKIEGNLPWCHFVNQKPHLESNPGGRPLTNRLSYGTALSGGFCISWAFERLRVQSRLLSEVDKTKYFQVRSTSLLQACSPINIVLWTFYIVTLV